jgi:cobalt-zinc-cadmium efflux system outer membrane protein
VTARGVTAIALWMLVAVPTAAPVHAQAAADGAGRWIDPVRGLTLEEAAARALAREPSIAAERQQLVIARGEHRQAGLRANPMLDVEQRVEPGGTDAQTTVMVEWPLELFRRGARVAAAEARVDEARHRISDRERQLLGEVRAAYGRVLVAVYTLDVLDRVIAAAARQRDLVASRVAEGSAPPLERDRLQVELGRLEAERQLRVGAVEVAAAGLRRLLGMSSAEPLTLRQTLDETVALADVDEPSSPGDRADVRAAAARVDVADAAIARAEREGRFDVGLYGGYMRMDAGFPQMGIAPGGGLERIRGVFHYAAGGLKLTLPIGSRNQGMRAVATAERAQAASALEAARLDADADRAAATAADRHAREAVRVYRDGLLALARATLQTVEQSYELGRGTLVDVIDERRRTLEIEREYAMTLGAAFEARTELLTAINNQQPAIDNQQSAINNPRGAR